MLPSFSHGNELTATLDSEVAEVGLLPITHHKSILVSPSSDFPCGISRQLQRERGKSSRTEVVTSTAENSRHDTSEDL